MQSVLTCCLSCPWRVFVPRTKLRSHDAIEIVDQLATLQIETILSILNLIWHSGVASDRLPPSDLHMHTLHLMIYT